MAALTIMVGSIEVPLDVPLAELQLGVPDARDDTNSVAGKEDRIIVQSAQDGVAVPSSEEHEGNIRKVNLPTGLETIDVSAKQITVFDNRYRNAVIQTVDGDDSLEELMHLSARRQLYQGYARGRALYEEKGRRLRHECRRQADQAAVMRHGVPLDCLRGKHAHVRRLIKCGYIGDAQGGTTFVSNLRD